MFGSDSNRPHIKLTESEGARCFGFSIFLESKPITLDSLFPGVRAGLLSATMLQPEHWWYMTELAKQLGVSPSSLQRELDSLVGAGFLLRRQDGRTIYFRANTESPLFPELRGIVENTTGVVPALRTALDKFHEKINLALIYGRRLEARNTPAVILI